MPTDRIDGPIFEMRSGIYVPVQVAPEEPLPALDTPLCLLCHRPDDYDPRSRRLNMNWTRFTCGHGPFVRHLACAVAIDWSFPNVGSEWRNAVFGQADCPVCGCEEEYC